MTKGRNTAPRAVCDGCRTLQQLRTFDGKIILHGRTADNPAGCPGSNQAPYRPTTANRNANTMPRRNPS